jgi:hypothetical protein
VQNLAWTRKGFAEEVLKVRETDGSGQETVCSRIAVNFVHVDIPPRRMLQLRPNFGHEGLFYRPLRNVHQIFRKRMVDVFELILISAATGCGSSKYVVGHDR